MKNLYGIKKKVQIFSYRLNKILVAKLTLRWITI